MIDAVLARGKLKQILSALDAERAVLINGPLQDLSGITAKRDQLLNALLKGGPVSQRILGSGLAEIREKAARNGALMKVVMKGIKDARKEIENMEENLNRIDTYSRDGARMVVSQVLPGKGHRV